MKQSGKNKVTGGNDRGASLSEECHQQVMELLRLADGSSNPDIRAAALEIAKEKGKHRITQESRVSPTLTLVLATLVILGVGAASWYAFIHYPEHLAIEICAPLFVLAFVLVAVYALYSDKLSQENFMRVMDSAWSRMRKLWPSALSDPVESLQAQESEIETKDQIVGRENSHGPSLAAPTPLEGPADE